MKAGHNERARRFNELHRTTDPFVIGSVWDPASAVVFERAGFAALGTSSAGVAYSQGFPDGQVIPLDAMIEAIGRIVDSVRIPVSADMEAGFGTTPEAIAAACLRAIEAGAVGVNIEDAPAGGSGSLVDVDYQCEAIRRIRQAAQSIGAGLFINARTDAFWLRLWDEPERIAQSIARARAYLEAGADGIFIPGALDPITVRTLTSAIDAPVNILAMPGCPDIGHLRELGVRRLSQGSGPARAALGLSRRIALELLESGTYSSFHSGALSYPDANQLFSDSQTRT